MAISIFVDGDRYQVAVTPPHAPVWRSKEPLTATEVLAKLSSLGCHSTDITDALYEADPNWTQRHTVEVLRQRRKLGVEGNE